VQLRLPVCEHETRIGVALEIPGFLVRDDPQVRDGIGVELVSKPRSHAAEPESARAQAPTDAIEAMLPRVVECLLRDMGLFLATPCRIVAPSAAKVAEVQNDLLGERAVGVVPRCRELGIDARRDDERCQSTSMKVSPEQSLGLRRDRDAACAFGDRPLDLEEASPLRPREGDVFPIARVNHAPESAEDEGVALGAGLHQDLEALLVGDLDDVVVLPTSGFECNGSKRDAPVDRRPARRSGRNDQVYRMAATRQRGGDPKPARLADAARLREIEGPAKDGSDS